MIKKIKVHFDVYKKEMMDYMITHFTEHALEVEKSENECEYPPSLIVTYVEGEKEAEMALNYAKENRIFVEWGIEHLIEFTEEEQEQIPYFKLVVSNTDIYDVPVSFCAEYEYKDCDECGAGAVQLTPLKIPVKVMSEYNYDIFGIRPEIIVSGRVKRELERNGVTGCEFWKMIDRKSGEETEEFFELKINTQLPLSRTPGRKKSKWCEKCGREGVMYTQRLQYNLSDFSEKKDFYISQEGYFWEKTGWHDGYWIYNVIISKKVCDIFRKFDNHYIRILPLLFEELYK